MSLKNASALVAIWRTSLIETASVSGHIYALKWDAPPLISGQNISSLEKLYQEFHIAFMQYPGVLIKLSYQGF